MSSSKVKLLLVIACCLIQVPLLAFFTPMQTQTSGLNLNYTVTIQKGQPYVHIRLEISGIISSSLMLRFKEEARYMENYVYSLSASSGGSPPNNKRDDETKRKSDKIEELSRDKIF
jgi:hypothetical protein